MSCFQIDVVVVDVDVVVVVVILFNWVFGVLRGFRGLRGFRSSSPPPAARWQNGSPGPRSARRRNFPRIEKAKKSYS